MKGTKGNAARKKEARNAKKKEEKVVGAGAHEALRCLDQKTKKKNVKVGEDCVRSNRSKIAWRANETKKEGGCSCSQKHMSKSCGFGTGVEQTLG